jgi:hypothetical protein
VTVLGPDEIRYEGDTKDKKQVSAQRAISIIAPRKWEQFHGIVEGRYVDDGHLDMMITDLTDNGDFFWRSLPIIRQLQLMREHKNRNFEEYQMDKADGKEPKRAVQSFEAILGVGKMKNFKMGEQCLTIYSQQLKSIKNKFMEKRERVWEGDWIHEAEKTLGEKDGEENKVIHLAKGVKIMGKQILFHAVLQLIFMEEYLLPHYLDPLG